MVLILEGGEGKCCCDPSVGILVLDEGWVRPNWNIDMPAHDKGTRGSAYT